KTAYEIFHVTGVQTCALPISTAMLTIARISRSSETEYYALKLLDPSYRAKSYALWAIAAYGDERATDAVHQYVKKNHKKLAEPRSEERRVGKSVEIGGSRI